MKCLIPQEVKMKSYNHIIFRTFRNNFKKDFVYFDILRYWLFDHCSCRQSRTVKNHACMPLLSNISNSLDSIVISDQVLPNFYFKYTWSIYFYVVHISILLLSTRTKTTKEKRNIALPYITRKYGTWLPIRVNTFIK